MELYALLIQLLNGVQYGLLLFLVASGLTLIFGIMGIINLAHGSFYMVGAYMAFAFSSATGSLLAGVVMGLGLSVGLGVVLEWGLFSRLYQRDHLDQVLLTYGLILVFEELRSLLVGNDVHGVPVFNRRTLQCGQSSIFIAGDVNNELPLLHEAADEGRIAGELGDLLLHFCFQVDLAEERGAFTFADVARLLSAKMKRRHPHLYAGGTAENWEKQKIEERRHAGTGGPTPRVLGHLPPTLPELETAFRFQERAAAGPTHQPLGSLRRKVFRNQTWISSKMARSAWCLPSRSDGSSLTSSSAHSRPPTSSPSSFRTDRS